MADSQNVPVFMRHYAEAEPRFLGRFLVSELDELAKSVRDHSCYWGDDNTTKATTQYICYSSSVSPRSDWYVGFEIVLGLTDDETYKGPD